MMEIVIRVLACVGIFAISAGIASLTGNLYDLFRRVKTLEVKDNVRQKDIIEIREQISCMEGHNK